MFLSIKNFCRGPYSLIAPNGEIKRFSTGVKEKWLPGKQDDTTAAGTTLVGIIDFLNRTLAGLTPRGVPMYFFHPLNPSYPPCVVSAKTNPRQNMLASVTIEHWNDKWPRGGIQKIHGPVGDREVEKAALIRSCVPSVKSALPTSDLCPAVGAATAVGSERWKAVFNIDPAGCLDVDDVFCLGVDGSLGIGIANVAAWTGSGAFDDFARALGQTLYVDGGAVVPMLPRELSENFASLRCDGVAKPMCVAIWKPGCAEPVWEIQMLQVSRSYSYESVVGTADFAEVVRLLGAVKGLSAVDLEDSHKVVEYGMVLYNAAAAKMLRTAGKGILRSHGGITNTELVALAEKSGIAELVHLGSSAGKYVRADAENVHHNGLGLDVYCHVTSPLRRYADLVNQRILIQLITGCTEVAIDDEDMGYLCNHLNWRSSIAKQLDRDLYFLQNLRTDSLTSVSGVVVAVKEGGCKVYVPAWKRKVKAVCGGGVDVGQMVMLRAHTNLRAVDWYERLVCVVEPGVTV